MFINYKIGGVAGKLNDPINIDKLVIRVLSYFCRHLIHLHTNPVMKNRNLLDNPLPYSHTPNLEMLSHLKINKYEDEAKQATYTMVLTKVL